MTAQPATDQRETFEGFAVLELMGHRRLAGWVSEQEIAGHGMLRIDIPNTGEDQEQREWASTHYYAPAALYSIIPCGKDEAYAIAESQMPQPISEWDVRSLLPDIKEQVRRSIEDDVRREYRAAVSAPVVDTYDGDDDDHPF